MALPFFRDAISVRTLTGSSRRPVQQLFNRPHREKNPVGVLSQGREAYPDRAALKAGIVEILGDDEDGIAATMEDYRL